MGDSQEKNLLFLYLAWAVALSAMLGSLYFSDVAHFVPCILCWYQRILLYPLVLILAVGVLRSEKRIYQYVLPFSVPGALLAAYHYLLYVGIIPEALVPCTAGASCTQKIIEWLGFINIPALSFLAFLIISIFVMMHRYYEQ